MPIAGWKPIMDWHPATKEECDSLKRLNRESGDPNTLVEVCHCFQKWSYRLCRRVPNDS